MVSVTDWTLTARHVRSSTTTVFRELRFRHTRHCSYVKQPCSTHHQRSHQVPSASYPKMAFQPWLLAAFLAVLALVAALAQGSRVLYATMATPTIGQRCKVDDECYPYICVSQGEGTTNAGRNRTCVKDNRPKAHAKSPYSRLYPIYIREESKMQRPTVLGTW